MIVSYALILVSKPVESNPVSITLKHTHKQNFRTPRHIHPHYYLQHIYTNHIYNPYSLNI